MAVAVRELHQPELADPQRVPLGAQVAQHGLRHARVGEDDRQDVPLLLAALPGLHRRDVQPLLEVIEHALDGLAAGPHAAHVGVVEDVGHEPDEAPVVGERGLDHEEVGEVSGPEEGAVEEHHVAGPEPVTGKGRHRVLGGERHRAHVPGAVRTLGDHASLRVEEAHGEVLTLAGLLGVRRPVDGGADLHGDRLEGSPDHTERDRIDPQRLLGRTHGFRSRVSCRPSTLTTKRCRKSVPRRPSMLGTCGVTS